MTRFRVRASRPHPPIAPHSRTLRHRPIPGVRDVKRDVPCPPDPLRLGLGLAAGLLAHRPQRRVSRVMVAVTAALTLTAATGAMRPAQTARAEYADPSIIASVDRWCTAYDVSCAYVERVIACESDFTPDIWNQQGSGTYGVLQYLPSTFYSIEASELRDPTFAPGLSSYDPETRWYGDPDAQVHLFAWFLHTYGYGGVASLWACA